ncbi:MAG TPA: hypothetical protein VF486_22250 [Actinomycetes bacterium]|jgi:hypothetical protein
MVRVTRLLVLIWILVGIFVAWDHGYLPERLLRGAVSALIAIIAWPLVLLGVNVHI